MVPSPEAARSDPACPICSKPVESGSLVLFQHGELIHIRCVSHNLGIKTKEEWDRSKDAKAQALEAIERAARLIQEAQPRRRGRSHGPARDAESQ
jgi:hypothetical protein